jgi:ABC-type amino acid transport substrate-binding protein
MAELLADNLSRRFDKKIKIIPVNIKSNERIGAVTSGKIDIEMGSTTYTALRDENVDFSLIFFISETTFIAKKSSGVTSLADLADKRLGSARGTSTLEQILSFVGKGFFKEENLYRFDSLSSGMKAVREGEIDAFATDRSLLEGLKSAEPDPENWIVLDTAIGYDPYAFMLSENQSDFRDFINNSIRWSVQTGEFYRIYDKWMGENGVTPLKMSPALKEYLNVIAIPMSPNWYKR